MIECDENSRGAGSASTGEKRKRGRNERSSAAEIDNDDRMRDKRDDGGNNIREYGAYCAWCEGIVDDKRR